MEWNHTRLDSKFVEFFSPSPPFRAILSFSRRAHWLSCCVHGGFFVRLCVEEWERWATWVGVVCGAVASALLRQSCDVAEALSEMFLVAPCALSEGRAHSLGLLQYSQRCHRWLIRSKCGLLRIHCIRGYHECKIRVLCRYSMRLLKYHIKCSSEEMALTE